VALADLRTLVDAIVAVGGSGTSTLFFMSPSRAVTSLGYVPALAAHGSTIDRTGPRRRSVCPGTDRRWRCVLAQHGLARCLNFPDRCRTSNKGGGVDGDQRAAENGFQTDSIARRAILRAAWCLRVPGAASWINTGLSW
jgi:hypothetical protein